MSKHYDPTLPVYVLNCVLTKGILMYPPNDEKYTVDLCDSGYLSITGRSVWLSLTLRPKEWTQTEAEARYMAQAAAKKKVASLEKALAKMEPLAKGTSPFKLVVKEEE